MRTVIYPWQKAPFTRLLVPFITGILLQWYSPLPASLLLFTGVFSLIIILSFFFIKLARRYRLSLINGSACFILLTSLGALLTHIKDIRHHPQWFGKSYSNSTALLVTLNEPLVEKPRSFKAEAVIANAKGKLIIYFSKDSLPETLYYGSRIIFKKPLQEIRNTGNPGCFDYKRHSLFQGITHQVYLKAGEYIVLPGNAGTGWKRFIYSLQERILTILHNNIGGEKESGLAEALLIGYKDDLDKTLVQSYTNTGVVHVIAISGLHLGLVYWLLASLFLPLKKRKGWKWARALLIVAGLWTFSCLAGAQASVIRSAFMFTCIVAGEVLSRKPNTCNTLALSAFLLLCYNPFWLWDIGFQLSYAAVLGLVLFMRPVYELLHFKNRFVNMIWKMNAVTLAAQLLTLPVCIYYFHQFPVYFLLTNLVAIPLSCIILTSEIILCIIIFIPAAAALAGKLITLLIRLMNTCIEKAEALPFSVWNGLQINLMQTILLTLFILCISYWLILKHGSWLKAGLLLLLSFVVLRSISFIRSAKQQKLIVYNIPQKQAIDIIEGRSYTFIGDPSAEEDKFIRNFHLKPSRVMHRLSPSLNNLHPDHFLSCNGKRIFLLNRSVSYVAVDSPDRRPIIDLLILSGNPRIYISQLSRSLHIKQIVADASVPAWKCRYWKKDCDSLHIPWHDVSVKGAFAMNLQ